MIVVALYLLGQSEKSRDIAAMTLFLTSRHCHRDFYFSRRKCLAEQKITTTRLVVL